MAMHQKVYASHQKVDRKVFQFKYTMVQTLGCLAQPGYQASLGANIGDVSKRDLRWET